MNHKKYNASYIGLWFGQSLLGQFLEFSKASTHLEWSVPTNTTTRIQNR